MVTTKNYMRPHVAKTGDQSLKGARTHGLSLQESKQVHMVKIWEKCPQISRRGKRRVIIVKYTQCLHHNIGLCSKGKDIQGPIPLSQLEKGHSSQSSHLKLHLGGRRNIVNRVQGFKDRDWKPCCQQKK